MRARLTWRAISNTRSEQLPFTLHFDGVEGLGRSCSDETCDTTLVCGFLGCDVRPFNPLIATLPRLLHLRANESHDWIAQFMRQAVTESQNKRPGGEAMLERMSEMMFVDAVRRYVDTLPEDSRGWLAGLRDRFVGRALALMHDAPATAVDRGRAGPASGAIALGAARALCRNDRTAADAVPGQLAHAGRRGAPAQHQCHRRFGSAGSRLRFGSGVRPGVQATGRQAARCLAPADERSGAGCAAGCWGRRRSQQHFGPGAVSEAGRVFWIILWAGSSVASTRQASGY